MIVDTSAIVAILNDEPEAARFALLIEQANEVEISAATVLEASLVVGNARQHLLDEFLDVARATVVEVDLDQLAVARDARRRYGRGARSRAKLNYADLFSYALAIAHAQPLLFKGDDFAHTDVQAAAAGASR